MILPSHDDSFAKGFALSRSGSNHNLNLNLSVGGQDKNEKSRIVISSRKEEDAFEIDYLQKEKQNYQCQASDKLDQDIIKEKQSFQPLSEEQSTKKENLSLFQKKFEKITWYGFIHTVSNALSLWKRSLKFVRMDEISQYQIEAVDDKAYYQSEWAKQVSIDKTHLRRRMPEYGFTQKKWIRTLKKNTREIRKFFREVEMKFSECKQTVTSRIRKTLIKLPVIDPLNKGLLFWELIYLIMTIIMILYLPYSVSFDHEYSFIKKGNPFWIFLAVFFSLDLVKECFTATYYKGEILRDPLKIFKNLIYSMELPLDIFTLIAALGIIPFEYSRALFMIRIFYKPSLIQKFKDALQISETAIATIDILNLFSTILYLGHVVACVWHEVGQIEWTKKQEGWIVKYNFEEESISSLYLNSYFFAIINMSSVKGSILPSTNTEKIFCMIIPFGACVLYGYTITSITTILRSVNNKRDNFNMLISKINRFMRRNNVEPQHQTRARKYVEYMKDSSLDERKASKNILNCLAPSLKDDIFINIYSQSLKKQQFIRQNFSNQCIDALALKMNSQFFASNEVIINQHTIEEPSLQIVAEGKVEEFFYPNNQSTTSDSVRQIRIKKKVCSKNITMKFDFVLLLKGELFGEYEFFSCSNKANINVRSIGVSEIHVLKLKDCFDVIGKFPHEKEHFANMKDQLLLNENLKLLHQRCVLCNEKDHIEKNCPYTFYEHHRRNLIKKLGVKQCSFSLSNSKVFNQRKEGKKYQSLMIQKTVENSVKLILEDGGNLLYLDEPEDSNQEEEVFQLGNQSESFITKEEDQFMNRQLSKNSKNNGKCSIIENQEKQQISQKDFIFNNSTSAGIQEDSKNYQKFNSKEKIDLNSGSQNQQNTQFNNNKSFHSKNSKIKTPQIIGGALNSNIAKEITINSENITNSKQKQFKSKTNQSRNSLLGSAPLEDILHKKSGRSDNSEDFQQMSPTYPCSELEGQNLFISPPNRILFQQRPFFQETKMIENESQLLVEEKLNDNNIQQLNEFQNMSSQENRYLNQQLNDKAKKEKIDNEVNSLPSFNSCSNDHQEEKTNNKQKKSQENGRKNSNIQNQSSQLLQNRMNSSAKQKANFSNSQFNKSLKSQKSDTNDIIEPIYSKKVNSQIQVGIEKPDENQKQNNFITNQKNSGITVQPKNQQGEPNLSGKLSVGKDPGSMVSSLTKVTPKSPPISIDYFKMREYKIYFPHNNFSHILKTKRDTKQNRKQTILKILFKKADIKQQAIFI